MSNSVINQLSQVLNSQSELFLIAGPCVVESKDLVFEVAGRVKEICDELGITYIFKSSYRKANRTKLDSFQGIGDEKALSILKEIGTTLQLPVTTDIHTIEEAAIAAQFVDLLQIPAFLCRQTELLLAAGKTGIPVNVKKGQFLNPQAMQWAVEKIESTGNKQILLTERGTTFGYQDLVVDFRSIPIMQSFNVPVILDCTHSLQQPNQQSGVTGGQPQLIATMAKAGVAVGVNGLFIETHPTPKKALSDGQNMLPLSEMKNLLQQAVAIKQAISR